jgi:hypothetical protein
MIQVLRNRVFSLHDPNLRGDLRRFDALEMASNSSMMLGKNKAKNKLKIGFMQAL